MSKKDFCTDEKMLDSTMSKYDLVRLAALHFNTLKHNNELNTLTVSQLIEKSLNDILTGEVSREEIIEKHKAKLQESAGTKEAEKTSAAQAKQEKEPSKK